MSLTEYLQKHFVEKAAFASLAGMSLARLDQLVAAGAIPDATYIGDGASIRSAVFGRIDTSEPVTGEYFRPECVRWVKLAEQAAAGMERAAVLEQLTLELRTAFESDECLTGESPAAIEARIQEALPLFFDGTFGLCVADPSTGEGIARKEVLQEKLTTLTDNGNQAAPEGISRSDLLKLVDDYARAAMPFSPAEYERSSRKRLVDDLRQTMAKI